MLWILTGLLCYGSLAGALLYIWYLFWEEIGGSNNE